MMTMFSSLTKMLGLVSLSMMCLSLSVAAAGSVDKVVVLLITEAGCPPCQQAIAGSLNDMVHAAGIAGIVDLQHHPFGNNYFATAKCGGGPYDPNVRHCWAKACVESKSPANDCFTGDIVTQHGPEESKVNKIEACAISHTSSWQEYWPFLHCMEEYYYSESVSSAAKKCAASAGIDHTLLMSCYNGAEGTAALIREAKATPDHPGTPYILVDGHEVYPDNAIAAVCAAYKGAKPAGCKAAAMEAQVQ